MSLKANLTGISDWENKCCMPDKTFNPITKTIVFMTMSVGMGKITEDNWQEFWIRANLVERVSGHETLEPGDIHRHVGLACNVAEESKARFKNRLVKNMRFDATKKIKRYTE